MEVFQRLSIVFKAPRIRCFVYRLQIYDDNARSLLYRRYAQLHGEPPVFDGAYSVFAGGYRNRALVLATKEQSGEHVRRYRI